MEGGKKKIKISPPNLHTQDKVHLSNSFDVLNVEQAGKCILKFALHMSSGLCILKQIFFSLVSTFTCLTKVLGRSDQMSNIIFPF